MATAPQNAGLPLFYNDLVPINTELHANFKTRMTDKARWMAANHVVPLTVEEFPLTQRHLPIVFSAGDDPIPLAMFGLNEGVNVFVEEDGTVDPAIYVPAYVRRYPFMLARLGDDADELSLCFDPTTDLVGEFDEGTPIFEGGEASDMIKRTLNFCEQFELAGQKTASFIAELKKHNLLIDGELTIQLENGNQPFVYRGFQMVDEAKLRELRGDVLRTWNQNGMLPLIFAHLFSLDHVRQIFDKQVRLGKGPITAEEAGQPANA